MLKLTRLTALFATLVAFLFMATNAAATAAQDTAGEAPVQSNSTMLYMLLIFALLVIVVIAFRRSQKKRKK